MHEQGSTPTNYYAVLQLEPDAPPEMIKQAFLRQYEHLHAVDGSTLPDDLRELLNDRLGILHQAYAVLSDPEMRAVYDAGRATVVPDRQPAPSAPRTVTLAGRIRLTYRSSVIGVGLLMVIVIVALVATLGNQIEAPSSAATEPPTTSTAAPIVVVEMVTDPNLRESLIRQEERIAQLRRIEPEARTVDDWIEIGNAVFDFVEVVRISNNDTAYRAATGQWVDAAEAYSNALSLRPLDGLVRSDYALSIMRYGEARDNPIFIQASIIEAERALQADPEGLRTMVNVGMVFAATSEDRIAEARQLWTKVMNTDPNSPPGQVAAALLETTDS